MAGWWLLARRLGGRGQRAAALAALQVAAGFAAVLVMLAIVGAGHALGVRQDRADAREARPSIPGSDVGSVSARDIELNGHRLHWVVVRPTDALKPPCGLDAWPSPGQSVVSPALVQALRSGNPDARAALADRPVAGTVGRCGLISDQEWVAYIGASDAHGLSSTSGFGAAALPLAGDGALVAAIGAMLAIIAGVPIAMLFLAIARFRSHERSRQAAQLELLGMRSGQAAVLQAAEASAWTVVGGTLAVVAFVTVGVRPMTVPLAGVRLAGSDLLPPMWAILLVVAALPLGVAGSIVAERARLRSTHADGPAHLGRQGLVAMGLGGLVTALALACIPLVHNHLYLILALLLGTCLQAVGLPSALPLLVRRMSRSLCRRTQRGWLLVSLATMAHRPGPAARAAGALSAAALALGVLLPVLHLLASDTASWETQTPERYFVWANLDVPLDPDASAEILALPDDPTAASTPSALLGSCAAFAALLASELPCPDKPVWVSRDGARSELPPTARWGDVALNLSDAKLLRIHVPSRPWDSTDRGAPTLLVPTASLQRHPIASGQYLFRVPDLGAERRLGARIIGHDAGASWSSDLESISFASAKGRAPTGTLLVFLGFGTVLLLAALVLAIVTQARDTANQTRSLFVLGAPERGVGRALRVSLLAPLGVGLLWSFLAASLNSAVMHALNPQATWSVLSLFGLSTGLALVGTVAASAAASRTGD